MLDLTTKFGRIARKHLKSEYFVWLTTVDSKGMPQPRPVWFIWEKETILIFSQANAYKLKHIQNNPNVSLHFNTEDAEGEKRLVIISGTAKIDRKSPVANKLPAYLRKYKSGMIRVNATPQQFADEYSVAIRITPVNLRGSE